MVGDCINSFVTSAVGASSQKKIIYSHGYLVIL